MSSKTKIVVLRMKEIIYTAIFAGLAILLITLCFIMFRHGNENTSETDAAKAQAVQPIQQEEDQSTDWCYRPEDFIPFY